MDRGQPATFYSTFPPDWSAGVLYVGTEACLPGHSWQGVRDHYLLHYVVDGRGAVREGRRVRSLSRGDAFVFTPGDYLRYTAHENDPWSYIWVGFGGLHADDLLEQLRRQRGSPVLQMPYSGEIHRTLDLMLDAARERTGVTAVRLTGLLYQLIATLSELRAVEGVRTTASDLVHEARTFMQQNYQREINVSDVIRHIGVDRSHFSRVFRAREGVSLRDYLIRIRIERARRLIMETDLTVRAVAASVGYRNYASFERRYRLHVGCSPSQSRADYARSRRSGLGP